jgi:hypothetical protein
MGNGNRLAQFRKLTINQIYYTVVKHQTAFRYQHLLVNQISFHYQNMSAYRWPQLPQFRPE